MIPPDIDRLAATLRTTLQAIATCATRTVDDETYAGLVDRARDLIDDLANAAEDLPDGEASQFARASTRQLAANLGALESMIAARRESRL